MSWDHATTEFNMVWENDYDVYHAVLTHARGLLARHPTMTDQILGRNIKDRVYSWAYGGGWGYSEGWAGATSSLRDRDRYPDWIEGPPPAGYRTSPFGYFGDPYTYGEVDEEAVGEEVREQLEIA